MTEQEARLIEKSVAFAKANRTAIARSLTDKTHYLPEQTPVSVFMSGSPGAGKTEVSKIFIQQLGENTIRLDPDELRVEFEDYNGANSYLFQKGVSLIVERTLDCIFKNGQSFILDGTFSSYPVANKNIKRSLDRDRSVLILFVYQEPELAWRFVQARARLEGRRILPETFVEQFFGAQQVIAQIKHEYGNRIKVDVVIKNNDGTIQSYHENVQNVTDYLRLKTSREALQEMVALTD